MPTITHDNFDLKKKSLIDSRLTPVPTFTLLPDPNVFGSYIPEGGIILVQDTNINYQVQVDLSNPPNLIWVDQNPSLTSPTAVAFIEITYSDLSILKSLNTLSKGTFYKITDRANEGIIVQALSLNTISLSAEAIYLVADLSGFGTYITTPLPFNSWKGVWYDLSEPSYSNGDIVIWDGRNYQVQNFASLNGTNPSTNTTAFVILPRSTRKGYILETNSIKYDFDGDIITERSDFRGNTVNGVGIALFQWGNNNVSNNEVKNSAVYNCINNRGFIANNTLSGSCIVESDHTNIGFISDNKFHSNGFTYKCNSTVLGNILLRSCDIYLNEDITFNTVSQYVDSRCGYGLSNFKQDIDMITSFSAGVLTLPLGLNYIGLFTLKNNSGQTISKILNTPTTIRYGFSVFSFNNQNFEHTAVLSAVAGHMVADSVGINNIVGRVLKPDDFIEYETLTFGILRRYNIVKLA